ncbi:LON peptidase N-terminal domain and RING finger protein C14F5.10c [Diplonema papillatum]|nr:LON peptidase N-terminal domain and RING finger protein C14F5.10c [Diplonema papillatum]
MSSVAELKQRLERECGSPENYVMAIDTLLRYAQNLLDDPNQPRFRNVNTQNKNFAERIGKYPSGKLLMEKLGFSSRVVEGRLVMPVGMVPQEIVLSELKGCCETPVARASDAAPVPVSARAKEKSAAPVPAPTSSGSRKSSKRPQHPAKNPSGSGSSCSSLPAKNPSGSGSSCSSGPAKNPSGSGSSCSGSSGKEAPGASAASKAPKLTPAPPSEPQPPIVAVRTEDHSAQDGHIEVEVKVDVAVHRAEHAETTDGPVLPVQPEELIWACSRCTFHNAVATEKCDMCGTPKVSFADAACSPKIAVPAEMSRITVTSVGVGSPVLLQDEACGTRPVATNDMACSPFGNAQADAAVGTSPVPQPATAEMGVTANLRHLKTPHPVAESEQYLEEGLLRVRKRLAELCKRSESANSAEVLAAAAACRTASASARTASTSAGTGTGLGILQDVTNVANRTQAVGTNTSQCPSAGAGLRGLSGTPLRRELTGALECGICLCLIVYPLTTPCGHSFCRHCLAEATAKVGKKCPTCRTSCDIDAMMYPENKVLANTAKLANSGEYSARKREADVALRRLRVAAERAKKMPVLIGDDCPCPGSTCKLQLAEQRDVALLRYISRNSGKFVLLPSTEGSRVRRGCIGLACTLRRAEDLPNGRASASVKVGHRVVVVKHETAEEGHTDAEVDEHVDSNEVTWESLAAAHHLKRILRDFFRTQSSSIQSQVERFAGPEPSLPPLPRGRGDAVSKGATEYSFWVAAVLSHLRILAKRLKPTLVVQSDALTRCTTLCHVLGSVLRNANRDRDAAGAERAERAGNTNQTNAAGAFVPSYVNTAFTRTQSNPIPFTRDGNLLPGRSHEIRVA